MATKKVDTAQAGQAEKNMQVYEVGFNLVSSLPEEKLAGEVATIKELIEKNGGSFISEEFPKLIPLAYTMERVVASRHEKFSHAYFGWIKFELESASINTVKQALDLNSSVLRYLLIKTVRENTLIGNSLKVKEKAAETEKVEGEKTEVNEAEIDKKIEDLVTDVK